MHVLRNLFYNKGLKKKFVINILIYNILLVYMYNKNYIGNTNKDSNVILRNSINYSNIILTIS